MNATTSSRLTLFGSSVSLNVSVMWSSGVYASWFGVWESTRGPTRSMRKEPVVTFVRQWALRVSSFGLTWLYAIYRVHPAVWRLMARNYRPWMARFARLHAWMTCQFAAIDVPAYGDFLRRNGWQFRWFDLSSYPPTDKLSYVKAYSQEQRCWHQRVAQQRAHRRNRAPCRLRWRRALLRARRSAKVTLRFGHSLGSFLRSVGERRRDVRAVNLRQF